jgi:predicted flap endonuclease-1-like 5' DNA nuclease
MTLDRNTRSLLAVSLTVVALFIWMNAVITPDQLPDWAVLAGLIVTGAALVLWAWQWLDLRSIRRAEVAADESLRLPQTTGPQEWDIPTQPVPDPGTPQMQDAESRARIMPDAYTSVTDTRYARQAGVPTEEMEFEPATEPTENRGALEDRQPVPEVIDKPQAEGTPTATPEPDDTEARDVGREQSETAPGGEAEVVQQAREGEPIAEEQVAEQSAAPPIPQPSEAEVLADAAQAHPEETGKPDDLTVIEGIGPVISRALIAAGYNTFRKLAEADPDHLRDVLQTAQVRVIGRSFETWPRQAAYAQVGDWDALRAYQTSLKGGYAEIDKTEDEDLK